MSDHTERNSPSGSPDSLVRAVEDRLLADESLGDEAKFLVLAALDDGSDDDFRTAAGQDGTTRVDQARQAVGTTAELMQVQAQAARVFLSGIEAEGFRGIGPTARMALKPGPGLTVIAGRNGCGKSSFAEAAEVAITGTSHRWANTKVARPTKSWRNLHHTDACRVALTLTEEGSGDTVVQTEWLTAAGTFGDGTCWVQRHSKPRERDRSALGWDRELGLYKPFLSHAELGEQLADGGRVGLYRAINSALGLERIDTALARLNDLTSDWGAAQKECDVERKALRSAVAELDDDRAGAVHKLLGRTAPDLATLADYATGQDDGGRAARLRRLVDLPTPDSQAFGLAVAEFDRARAELRTITSAAMQQDGQRREMLQEALALFRRHGPGRCPVCESGTVDAAWAERVQGELDSADAATRAAAQANASYRQAAQRLMQFRTEIPASLAAAQGDPLPQAALAFVTWQRLAALADPDALAGPDGPAIVDELSQRLADLRSAAQQELERVRDTWQPVALRLARWLEPARRAERMRDKLTAATAARGWMRTHADEIRNQRLEPINGRTQQIWELLRQDSNVSFGPLALKGAGNQRRVVFSSWVDGEVDETGMDVLSQGELNAFALALFLPRVELVASPFGFVMIDDPVQAMDPAKVDGLARVLSALAETRQVVVFTHDDRLPEAVKRLQIAATILSVHRHGDSVVTVSESSDPVTRYLEQARVIARDEDILLDVRRRVVPRLCRDALERQCKEIFYRRELRRGTARNEVEQRWQQARQTKDRLMLVVNKPGERNLDRWLGNRAHRHETLGACSSAVHDGWNGDPIDAVASTARAVADLVGDHG